MPLKGKKFNSHLESSTKLFIQQLIFLETALAALESFARVGRAVSSKQHPLVNANNLSHCCILSILRTFWFAGFFPQGQLALSGSAW